MAKYKTFTEFRKKEYKNFFHSQNGWFVLQPWGFYSGIWDWWSLQKPKITLKIVVPMVLAGSFV